MNAFEIEAVRTALQNMQSKGYFNICTIDQILKVTGGVPDPRDYEALRLLHCVNFRDMPHALRLALPRKIQLVVESAPMQLLKNPASDSARSALHDASLMLNV